jgi:hypothetical protein
MMAIPRRRLISERAAINVMFFGSEAKKMLELPSSGDGRRVISPINAQGLLSTSLRRGT